MSQYKKLTDAMYADLTPKERISYVINTLSIYMRENPVDIKRALRKAAQRTTSVSVKRYKENTIIFNPIDSFIRYTGVEGYRGGFQLNSDDFDVLFDGKPYTLGTLSESKKTAIVNEQKERIEETKNLLMSPYDDPIGNATRFAAKLGCDPDALCTVIAGALCNDWHKVGDELSATYDENEDTFTISYLDIKVTVKDGDIFSSPSN